MSFGLLGWVAHSLLWDSDDSPTTYYERKPLNRTCRTASLRLMTGISFSNVAGLQIPTKAGPTAKPLLCILVKSQSVGPPPVVQTSSIHTITNRTRRKELRLIKPTVLVIPAFLSIVIRRWRLFEWSRTPGYRNAVIAVVTAPVAVIVPAVETIGVICLNWQTLAASMFGVTGSTTFGIISKTTCSEVNLCTSCEDEFCFAFAANKNSVAKFYWFAHIDLCLPLIVWISKYHSYRVRGQLESFPSLE